MEKKLSRCPQSESVVVYMVDRRVHSLPSGFLPLLQTLSNFFLRVGSSTAQQPRAGCKEPDPLLLKLSGEFL